MRIRKRPPRVVEQAARAAAPIVGGKHAEGNGVPESLHAKANISHRSERLCGGGVGNRAGVGVVTHVVDIQVRPRDRGTEEGEGAPEEEPGEDKKEDASSELLMKSLLVVFERAGIRGLTAREVVAKLVEYELPGLQEGERNSVQVAKVLRTPDFVHHDSGKYFIYPSTPHAVVAESSTHSEPQAQREPDGGSGNSASPTFNKGGSRRQQQKRDAAANEVSDKVLELKKRRRRQPSSQHELAIGPRQCKRYDGRGWQCSKETEEGFSFCEHHQALMNKRTLRLNLAKMKRTSTSTTTTTNTNKGGNAFGEYTIMAAAAAVAAADESPPSVAAAADDAAPHGIEDLIHNQRRKLVKARSLKSIK